jgi:hypothetical protein
VLAIKFTGDNMREVISFLGESFRGYHFSDDNDVIGINMVNKRHADTIRIGDYAVKNTSNECSKYNGIDFERDFF